MLVPTVGIEPTSSPYEGAALPLSYVGSGGSGGARTRNNRLKRPPLYPLSYRPLAGISVCSSYRFVFGAWGDNANAVLNSQGEN